MLRISTLEMVNVRSYSRTKMPLKQRTVIVGPNGSGKSTTIDMLRYALTGCCEGVNGSNRSDDVAEMIRQGQGEGGVRLFVDGVGKVSRQSDGKEVVLKIAEWTGSNKKQQEALYEYLETTEAVITACLDSESFLRLHHSDAKSLIMGVLNVTIPAAPLEPLGIAGPIGLEERERLYKIDFDKRTIAKRQLDDAIIAPMPEGDAPPSLDELAADLAEVREQEKDCLEDGAEARGRKKALEEERARLKTERDTLNVRFKHAGDPHADLDRHEAALAKHQAAEPSAREQEAVGTIAEVVEAEEQEIATLRTRLADERGRLKMIDASVEGIDHHDPKKGCVLDASIPCQTPAKEFTGKLKAIRTDIKTLQKSIGEADARLSWLTAEATGRQHAMREAERRNREARAADRMAVTVWRDGMQGIERQIASAKSAIADVQTWQERMTAVVKRLSAIDTEIADLGDVTPSAALVDVRARIARGEQIMASARAWLAAKVRHDEDMARTAHLRSEVTRLEERCAALGPKGLIVDAIEAARYRFEERVNRALAKWGFTLEFQIDPWTIRVNGRKSTQLSKSQKLRVGIALQLAIAEITGLWFVAIDQADTLDAVERGILQDVIDGWAGQVIVCATKDPGFAMPTTLPEGMAFYRLELREAVTHVEAA